MLAWVRNLCVLRSAEPAPGAMVGQRGQGRLEPLTGQGRRSKAVSYCTSFSNATTEMADTASREFLLKRLIPDGGPARPLFLLSSSGELVASQDITDHGFSRVGPWPAADYGA